MPESFSCWILYIYIYTASPLPVRKQNSAAQHFYAAVERAPLSMRRFRVIMPITQGLPQRNESFECSQKDGHRRYGPRAVREVQPDRGALEHEHEVARQSVRGVSRNLNNMRNPSTRRTFYLSCTRVCMGLNGSTCSECLPVVISQISRL